MNYLKHIIVDNFFDDFELIEDEFKKIILHNLKDFNQKFNESQNWPGNRSGSLNKESPFLFNLYNKEFNIKIGNLFKDIKIVTKSYIHLRLKEDSKKDWIHRDSDNFTYTCLIYLSKTNINSGTRLFSDDEKIITDIKFIQNRAVFFDARYLHSAYGHYGTSINDGRLTLNTFYKKI